MFLPEWLSAGLIRAVAVLQGRGVWRAYQRLSESQWWAPNRIAELQAQKLEALLADLSERSTFWKERLKPLEVRSGARGATSLAGLAILEREDLMRHAETLNVRSVSRQDAVPYSTGGSTGQNVRFLVDRACWRERDAADLRLWSFLGLGPGATVASVWGSPMDQRAAARFRERARRIVDNRRLFSAYRIGDRDLDHVLNWLGRERPSVLTGYASVLDALARRAAERGGIEGPKIVVSCAEVLFPDQRLRIEQSLGAEVFNLYGCREVGLVAVECGQHRGLHVMDERLIVEVPGAGEDRAAEILLTDLDNRSTPFVRYRIGDLASPADPGACPCGRGLSRIGSITGRSFDIIRGPGGRAVGGTFWSLLLRTGVSGVESFQVIQHASNEIEIRVAPLGALGTAGRQTVEAAVHEALGESVAVGFTECDHLDPLPSGKHRFIVALSE